MNCESERSGTSKTNQFARSNVLLDYARKFFVVSNYESVLELPGVPKSENDYDELYEDRIIF